MGTNQLDHSDDQLSRALHLLEPSCLEEVGVEENPEHRAQLATGLLKGAHEQLDRRRILWRYGHVNQQGSSPGYLRTPDDTYALSEYGPALGRRFRSLKLWAVLRCYGADGLRRIQREHMRLARIFPEWVDLDPDWELVAPPRFSLVVFRRNGSDEENEEILERANRSGEIFLSHTKLNGRYVMRLAIGNARTTESDVQRAWEVLNE